MTVADKWLVLQDGCVMNVDTGAILWSSKNKDTGKEQFKLVDDKGKVHFFFKNTLLEMRKEEQQVLKAYAAKNDWEEWGDMLDLEFVDKPQIVEDFKETLGNEIKDSQSKLNYSIEKDHPKDIKMGHKENRDRLNDIMDFIDGTV